MQDKRKYIRISIIEYVSMQEQFSGKIHHGTISNISIGGVSVITKDSIPIDTPLYLTFNLPGSYCVKAALSVVMRSEEISNKFYHGLMFLKLSFEDIDHINTFVAREYRRRVKLV